MKRAGEARAPSLARYSARVKPSLALSAALAYVRRVPNPGQIIDGTTLETRNLPRIQAKLGIGVSTLTGTTDPNGVVTGSIGQVYTQVVGVVVTVWVNVDGGTTWVT